MTNSSSRILSDIILQSNGKFVTVDFIKKDGSLRTLTGRLGVTKHLRGGVSTLNPEQYITIYDTQKAAYRSINRDTIKSIRASGVVASVVG